jgi:hypothetical protein
VNGFGEVWNIWGGTKMGKTCESIQNWMFDYGLPLKMIEHEDFKKWVPHFFYRQGRSFH